MFRYARKFVVAALAITLLAVGPIAWAESASLFDMGGPDTPLKDGYAQVLPSTVYTPESGYGWETPGGESFDRSPFVYQHFGSRWPAVEAMENTDALTIDGIAGPEDMTFAVSLPAGTCRVIAVVGDIGGSRHGLSVYANGELVTDNADAFIYRDRGSQSDYGGIMRVRFTAEPRDGVLRIGFRKADQQPSARPPGGTPSGGRPPGGRPSGGRSSFGGSRQFSENSVLGVEIYPFSPMPLELADGKLTVRPEFASGRVPAALEAYNSGDIQEAANLFANIQDEDLLLAKAAGLLWAAGNLNLDLEFGRRIQADPELRAAITIDRVELLAQSPDLWTDSELVAEAIKVLDLVLEKAPADSAANELMTLATIFREAQRLFHRDPAIRKYGPMWIADAVCRQISPDDPLYPRALWYRARVNCGIDPNRSGVGWARGEALFKELQKDYPDDKYVKMYLLKGEMVDEVLVRPGEAAPPPPPIPRKYEWGYEGAPQWAAALRDATGWWIDVVEWWGNNRQRPDGSIGGGWSDDVEILRDWWLVAASGLSPKAYDTAKKLADGIWESDMMNREWGIEDNRADAEHILEMSADSHPHMVFLDYGDPTYIERCMISFKPVIDFYTGINSNGHRHAKAWHFGPDWIDPDPAGAVDATYNGRLRPPGISLVWYNGNPAAKAALVEWAKAWTEDAKSTSKSKPAGFLPLGVAYKDCEQGSPGSEAWWEAPYTNVIANSPDRAYLAFFPQSFTYHLCLLAYKLTGDEAFLDPYDAAWRIASEYLESPVNNPPMGSAMWLGSQLTGGYYGAELPLLFARVREATATTKYDDYVKTTGQRINHYGREVEWGSLEYARYLIDGDKQHIVDGADAINHTVVARGFEMLTGEVFMTDRAGFGGLLERFLDGAVMGPVNCWGVSMPEIAVTWEGFDKQFTPLVVGADSSHLKVLAYNFSEGSKKGGMRLWRLKPGWRYTLTMGPDSDGDDVPDTVTSSATVDLMHRGDSVQIEVPPRATQVIELKAAQKLRDLPDLLPDAGISARDVFHEGGRLTVRVHSIGGAPLSNLAVEAYRDQIKPENKIGSGVVEALDAPNDLVPKTATVSMDWMPGSVPARVICVLDPKDEIYEITERNNRVEVTLGQ